MNNLFFYPTLTEDLQEQSGCVIKPYEYSYIFNGEKRHLAAKGKNVIKLEDTWESWKIETDGLHLRREIRFEYPEVLYGSHGIACKDAKIGLCIIWTNRTLTQMGTIKPASISGSGSVRTIVFDYSFLPGEISGDLELETILYIQKSADSIQVGEESLMNETGVNIGVLDSCRLDFGSTYMDFPIQEVNSKEQPLWWLDLSSWTDPKQDLFNEDSIRLFLNTSYDCCPRVGDKISNETVLIDIISTAYTMIFQKIQEMDCLKATMTDVGLEPGSICKIMFYFVSSCQIPIDTSSIERLHRTIWLNVEKMIKGGEDE